MLDKIQTKIESLTQGKKLILGPGIRAEELTKVISLCEDLQSQGIIQITKTQNGSTTTSIIVEKK